MRAPVAQLVERFLGKEEVASSNLAWGFFVSILLIRITVVHAPNVCDPFNPCGCNPPVKTVDVHLPIQGRAVIRYEEKGFGIIARSCSKLFDRDRVEP